MPNYSKGYRSAEGTLPLFAMQTPPGLAAAGGRCEGGQVMMGCQYLPCGRKAGAEPQSWVGAEVPQSLVAGGGA